MLMGRGLGLEESNIFYTGVEVPVKIRGEGLHSATQGWLGTAEVFDCLSMRFKQ